MLPAYLEHVKAHHGTLLSRYFALFRVKPHMQYVLVVSNVFDTSNEIHQVRHMTEHFGKFSKGNIPKVCEVMLLGNLCVCVYVHTYTYINVCT